MKINPSFAIIAASAMVAGAVFAQDADKPAESPQPKEETKNVSPEEMKSDISYFLGFQNGRQMGQIPTLTIDDIDAENFMKGIKDGMVNKPAKEQEALQASLAAFQKLIDQRIAEQGKVNLEASKKFMEENGKKEGVVTTPSGLQYKVINKGGDTKYDAAKNKEPMFTIKYKGTLPDGTVFDETKGEAIDMPLQVIPGFAEALKTMPVGAKWEVFIPAELAYGENSPGAPIQPNNALIFEIELEGIKEAPEPSGSPMQISPEQLQQMLEAQQQQQGK